jgi:DNA-binding transcriptional MerR regulator/copper chaperone CopZ
VETIRFYERRGLIKQPVRPKNGGYRFYEDAVVERIRFIRQAQELGFSLREIMELLALRADPAADCGNVRVQAMSKRQEVDRKIIQLQHMRAALDTLIAGCPGGGALCACTILDALTGHGGEKADQFEPSRGEVSRESPRRRRNVKGASMKAITLRVDGMHCNGCARTIAAIVSAEPGVQKATVSFDMQEARILFDERATSEECLAKAVQRAGYEVVGRSS